MTAASMFTRTSTANQAQLSGPRALDTEWAVIGAAGLAFVIMGAMDLALVWYPSMFGSPDWEFASVTASLNGLPVPALGALLMVAAGIARYERWWTRVASLMLIGLALFVVCAGLLYATTAPQALQTVQNDVVRTGLFKAATKTIVQCVVYPLVFIVAAVRGWKASNRA